MLVAGAPLSAGPSIALAWNPNTETNVAGYHLYYGTASGIYSGNVTVAHPTTVATVTNLQPDTIYYFAVTAFSTDGLESDYSTEISYWVPGPVSTNTPPVALPGSAITAEEQPVGFTLRGTDINGDPLTYVIVTPPANGLISGASPNLTYRPNANFFGTDSLVFRVNDGRANSGVATITITVTAVNDPPTLAALINLSLPVNAGPQSIPLSGIGSGAANEAQTLIVAASSSNPSVIPQPQVSYVSPGTSGTLSFTPVAEASGVATITVTVDDGQSVNHLVTRTFVVTVGAPGNQPPTINPLADVVCNEDAPQQLVNFSGITAGAPGESQIISVAATSSHPGLIPHPTVRYDSPVSGGYLTFTPVPGEFGTAEITVTVNDGQPENNLTTRSFQVTVNPLNDPPTLDRIDDVELREDDGGRLVPLTGISTGATNEQQNIVITAVSSNPTVIPDPVVRYDSPSTNGSLYVTSVTNGVGSATITVTVNDGGEARNTVVRTFYVAVRGVNDAPIMSRIPNQVIAANHTSGILLFTVEDPDTSLASVSVQATSSNPGLVPPTGLAVGGTGANRTLKITPVIGVAGKLQVTVAATDGYSTNSQVVEVTVGYVNQAPVLSSFTNQTIDVSSTLHSLPFQVSDPDNEFSELVVSAASSNPGLVTPDGLILNGTNEDRTLTVLPLAGKLGTTLISVAVTDGTRRVQKSFVLEVREVRAVLTLSIRGEGDVTPNLNGQELLVGQTYTVSAVPRTGQSFVGWSGGVVSTGRSVSFPMVSNLAIVATFEPDPYFVMQGTYNGLIAEDEAVRQDTSGFMTLAATSRGSYSGKLQVGAGKYAIRGLLGRNGRATNQVLRPGLEPLTVELAVGLGDDAGHVLGRVTEGTWTARLEGDRPGYNAKTNPAPFAGSYTLSLPADESSPDSPPGSSYATVRIDGNGVASLLGLMADGSKSVQKVPLSQSGHWPFYLPLYRGGGAALGWLRMNSEDREVGGLVSWIKPAAPSRYYAGGFTNEATLIGTAYVPPSAEELKSGTAQVLDVACLGGNLAETVQGELSVLPNGRPLGAGGPVKFGLSPATGLFKGTVQDPATGKSRTFSGVVHQKWGTGFGVVIGLDEIGLVEISGPAH